MTEFVPDRVEHNVGKGENAGLKAFFQRSLKSRIVWYKFKSIFSFTNVYLHFLHFHEQIPSYQWLFICLVKYSSWTNLKVYAKAL